MNVNAETRLRLATVNATGDEYIVLRMDFRDGVVYCMGEVVATEGARVCKTNGPKTFALDAVTIARNVRRNTTLLGRLFRQAVRNAPGQYTITRTRAGNVYADLTDVLEAGARKIRNA